MSEESRRCVHGVPKIFENSFEPSNSIDDLIN